MQFKSEITVNGTKLENNDGKIAVYIAGEVLNPGVYYMEEESRIVDLLEVCGGLSELADITDINLAQKLEDSDKIDIPKMEIENDSKIEEGDSDSNEQDNSGLININTASLEELKTLNGIGDSIAQKIIDYRKNNKFESIEEIQNVNGIGASKYEQIKEYICVN